MFRFFIMYVFKRLCKDILLSVDILFMYIINRLFETSEQYAV